MSIDYRKLTVTVGVESIYDDSDLEKLELALKENPQIESLELRAPFVGEKFWCFLKFQKAEYNYPKDQIRLVAIERFPRQLEGLGQWLKRVKIVAL